MTRDEEIRRAAGNVAIRDNKGQYAHGFLMQALREAFTEGARWADSHPRWISVEDERIRKKLISFVENWKNFRPNSPFDDYAVYTSDRDECDRILAWLEKQGHM